MTILVTEALREGDGIRFTNAAHAASVSISIGNVPGAWNSLVGSQCLLTLEDQSSIGLLEISGNPLLFRPQWITGDPSAIAQVRLVQSDTIMPYSEWIATLE